MLSGSSYIPPFYFYQFADAISAPYTALKAYQSGIIDSNGNILKPESSLDPFEYLVIKLKQIFAQLPYGTTKAKLNGYLSTLQLFAEEAEEYNFNSEYMHALIEGYISQITDGEVSYLELCEDMGSGGGAAGSLGTPMAGSGSNVGVAGFDPPMTDKILKRKYLENCEIFDVCPDEYVAFKNAKAWKHIPEGPTKNYLQRFQRRNKDAKIGIRTTLPESGEQDLYWITYPAKNFMEEYGLEGLVGLLESNAIQEVNPNKNLSGTTSTEEVLTYFQDRNKDGNPDGQHHGRIATSITNLFNIGSEPAKQKMGILHHENAPEGHHAELHARLLSLGRGLDDLHKIEDQSERHSAISNFLESHVKGSAKSPSSPDRPRGKSFKDNIPDTFLYDPNTKQTVHAEVKTSTAAGAFATRWPSFGKKLRKSEWEREGIQPTDLEKTTAGRYRIKLPSEVSQELSQEAATQLVRYGKKSGPRTIIKAKDNNFYHVDTADVMEHWASGLDFPSVKRRSRGKEQEQINPETGGHTVELTPLKGFISKAVKGKSRTKATRLTMSKRAYETIRLATDPSLHKHLERLLLPHTKD
jgi:hypothetical protein